MMVNGSWDVIIAGGGIMGASAAFWLTRMGVTRVLVVEKDPSHARSSTALSVASIRQQFTTPVNVEISRFGFAFLASLPDYAGPGQEVPDLGLVENGYLFLAGSDAAAHAMRGAAAMQCAHGAATRLLDPPEIAQRFPYLATGDVVLGSWGAAREGWFDNMGLLRFFRSGAEARGAVFVTDEVTGLDRDGLRISGLRLRDRGMLHCGVVVNAMGTAAARLLGWWGEKLPVEPRKRTVFLVDAPEARHPDAPLIVDHSGIYMRPEGGCWLAGVVPSEDGPADPEDFEPDWRLFEELIWERLWRRMPGFAAAKALRAWAGHYAYNTLDQNAIVGVWPGCDNLILMNGFSGHGLQQAPAMGRGVAELIVAGRYRTLDLSPLGPDRLAAGRALKEQAVV